MRKVISIFVVSLFLLMIGLALFLEHTAVSSPAPTVPPALQSTPQPTVPSPSPTVPDETQPPETQPPETQPTEPQQETAFFAVAQDEAYNKELQRYVPEQARIEGNLIYLTGVKDGEDFLSGKVESKVAFRYGTFAFRIKTVQGKGLFPAIWMLPLESNRYPEVDIYEMIGSKPYELHHGIHFSSLENAKHFFIYPLHQSHVDDGYILKFVWAEDRMDWYLDDMLIGSVTYNIPDMPMFLICNLAIGGSWAGYPTEDSLPAVFELEVVQFEPVEIYVR